MQGLSWAMGAVWQVTSWAVMWRCLGGVILQAGEEPGPAQADLSLRGWRCRAGAAGLARPRAGERAVFPRAVLELACFVALETEQCGMLSPDQK